MWTSSLSFHCFVSRSQVRRVDPAFSFQDSRNFVSDGCTLKTSRTSSCDWDLCALISLGVCYVFSFIASSGKKWHVRLSSLLFLFINDLSNGDFCIFTPRAFLYDSFDCVQERGTVWAAPFTFSWLSLLMLKLWGVAFAPIILSLLFSLYVH